MPYNSTWVCKVSKMDWFLNDLITHSMLKDRCIK
jgi:hypothetical protein